VLRNPTTGPCRGFTPSLCATYNKLAAAGKTAGEFEVVFASSDRDASAFDEYYGEMPFAALPYADRARKEALSELFGVRGIPTLVFLEPSGKVITTEGRGAISADPDGKDFPWRPKPLNPLESGGGALNEKACVIALCEGAGDDAARAAVEGAMLEVATATLAADAAGGGAGAGDDSDDDEESPFAFFVAKEGGRLAGIVRERLSIGSAADKPVALLILDTSDNGAFYVADSVAAAADVTADSVRAFVAAYSAKTLTRQQMS